MIQEAERCLEIHDGIQRFGFLIKFYNDPNWYGYSTLPVSKVGDGSSFDLYTVRDTPQEAFKDLADLELRRGYDIRRDAPEELLR